MLVQCLVYCIRKCYVCLLVVFTRAVPSMLSNFVFRLMLLFQFTRQVVCLNTQTLLMGKIITDLCNGFDTLKVSTFLTCIYRFSLQFFILLLIFPFFFFCTFIVIVGDNVRKWNNRVRPLVGSDAPIITGSMEFQVHTKCPRRHTLSMGTTHRNMATNKMFAPTIRFELCHRRLAIKNNLLNWKQL